MPEYLAPGVYVEEIDTGNKPIEGVSTSTAGMLGVTERGPVDVPILVTSYGEYMHWFGERLNKVDFSNGSEAHCYLPHAVEGFFTNSGKRAYITRVLDKVAAVWASTFLFDRGTPTSLSTLLLRRAGELTGTAANPPLLYVLDGTGFNPNEWIRVGDGSDAEYKQVDPGFVSGTPATTHVALDFPLSRSHNPGVIIQEFPNTPNHTFTLVTPNNAKTPTGTQTIVLSGSTGDINSLSTPDQLLEIGDANQGEYRFVMNVTNVKVIGGGNSQASVLLDSSLLLPHEPGPNKVRSLQKTWPTADPNQSNNLDSLGATAGDRLVFVATRNGQFATRNDLVVINPADTTTREARRIGELDRLPLVNATTEMYPAGSVVEAVTLADDTRTVSAVSPTNTTITLNDITSLVVGQKVLVDPGANQELRVILSVNSTTKELTFTAALINPHPTPFLLSPVAKTTTAVANASATLIALDDRLGLAENDVLRIGAAPNEEYATIKLIPNRVPGGAAPDAGNVLLSAPLSHSHARGTLIWREQASTVATVQPTVTVLDAPAGVSWLLMADGNGYGHQPPSPPPPNFIRLTTLASDVFYHRIAPSAPVTPAQITLSTALERAHAIGSVVVARNPLLQIQALDAGAWGNRLRVSIEDEPAGLVSRTTIANITTPTHIRLSSAAGIEAGTVLEVVDPLNNDSAVGEPLKVVSINRASNYTIVLQGTGLSGPQQAPGLVVRSREFRLTVQLLRQPDPAQPSRNNTILTTEVFRYLSMDSRHSRYVQTIIGDIKGLPLRLSDNRPEGQSWYVRVHDLAQDFVEPNRTNTLESARLGPEALIDILPTGRQQPARQALEGGDDSVGTLSDITYIGQDDPDPTKRTGLYTFNNVDDISIVACPGRTSAAIQEALINHCELSRYRFAVLDGPPPPDDTLTDVQTQRQQFDTKYAALYHPWLLIPDPFPADLANIANYAIPPGGHVLGVYARTDIERGVHKAPANEVVAGILGLQRVLNKGEQDILNPYPVNINVIRDFRHNDRGIRVFGARVITSDPDWKYVNVRRLLIFIEDSIDRGLQWVVFEPNAEPLWARVRRTISNFLTVVWRNGALEGTKPEEAYFVKCDRTTMTQTDIDNGRLICVIGVAPVKPAEFVIIRIGLWTANANA
jgi:phage tail sheath protein FI